MKKASLILSLVIISGCSSLPKEQIINDADNNLKITEIQQQMDSEQSNSLSNDKNYWNCVEKITKLRQINGKNITESDIDYISSLYPGQIYNDVTAYKKRMNYGGISDKYIQCEHNDDVSKSKYVDSFDSYCRDKYLHENGLLSVALLPLRLTNVVLSIGTLGVFPLIHGPIYSDYKNCKSLSNKLSLNNSDNTNSFTEDEMNKLKDKITEYCQINYWDKLEKVCDSYTSLKKGCLLNFDGYIVADFGVRKDGVTVVNGYMFGNAVGGEYFIYDTNKYYEHQEFNTNGYWYSYVGVYDGMVQKLPAFKRTNQTISTSNEWCQYVKPKDD